jgi:hypothetical protein
MYRAPTEKGLRRQANTAKPKSTARNRSVTKGEGTQKMGRPSTNEHRKEGLKKEGFHTSRRPFGMTGGVVRLQGNSMGSKCLEVRGVSGKAAARY